MRRTLLNLENCRYKRGDGGRCSACSSYLFRVFKTSYQCCEYRLHLLRIDRRFFVSKLLKKITFITIILTNWSALFEKSLHIPLILMGACYIWKIDRSSVLLPLFNLISLWCYPFSHWMADWGTHYRQNILCLYSYDPGPFSSLFPICMTIC